MLEFRGKDTENQCRENRTLITDERNGYDAQIEGDRNFAGVFGDGRRFLPSRSQFFQVICKSADDVSVGQTRKDEHQTENDTDNRSAAEFVHC